MRIYNYSSVLSYIIELSFTLSNSHFLSLCHKLCFSRLFIFAFFASPCVFVFQLFGFPFQIRMCTIITTPMSINLIKFPFIGPFIIQFSPFIISYIKKNSPRGGGLFCFRCSTLSLSYAFDFVP